MSDGVLEGLVSSGVEPDLWRIALDPRLRVTIVDVERMTVGQIRQCHAMLALFAEQDLRRLAAAAHDKAQREAAQRGR